MTATQAMPLLTSNLVRQGRPAPSSLTTIRVVAAEERARVRVSERESGLSKRKITEAQTSREDAFCMAAYFCNC